MRARLQDRRSDPAELLERQISLLEQAQDGLQDDFLSGPGGLMRTLTVKDQQALAAITKALESAVACQIRLHNHESKEGKRMSAEERITAAIDTIKGLETLVRQGAINVLVDYHSTQDRAGLHPVDMRAHKMKTAATTISSLVDDE